MENRTVLLQLIESNTLRNRDGILNSKTMMDHELTAGFLFMPEAALMDNDYDCDISKNSLERLSKDLSYIYDTTPEALKTASSRKTEEREARQMAHFMSRMLTISSLNEIGNFFGNRDHSTVIHSSKVMCNEFDTNYAVANKIHLLCNIYLIPISNVYDFIDSIRTPKLQKAS